MDNLEQTWSDRIARHGHDEKAWLIVPVAPERSAEHRVISYRDLSRLSHHAATVLRVMSRAEAQRMIIVSDNSPECCLCIMAALVLGLTIVSVAPPSPGGRRERWHAQLDQIISDCAPAILLGSEHDLDGRRDTPACQVASFTQVVDWNTAVPATRIAPLQRGAALWQYTSGTTGSAKIAQISDANLIHNIVAIGRRIRVSDKDVNTIWLPLFHDMGLIGSLLFAAYWRISGVLMSPRMFAARPESWLWAIARFGVTCSAAPNAAYEICASRLDERKLEGLDLSSWRVAFNGAERVHRGTVERFCARYAGYGFRKEAIYPVYGLAEHTLAAAMPEEVSGAEYDWVDGSALDALGRAVTVSAGQAGAQAMTSVGSALPGHEIRIVAPHVGEVAGERTIGEVQLRGPSCMVGYRGAQSERKGGDWLETGDLGYLAEGRLYVVGRSKHIIKRGGRSISAELIEGSVRSIDGVRGAVAAFGTPDDAQGTERIIVLAESARTEHQEQQRIRREILRAVQGTASCVPDVIQLVEPGSIPRTTSGKVRHTAARQAYLEGRYSA